MSLGTLYFLAIASDGTPVLIPKMDVGELSEEDGEKGQTTKKDTQVEAIGGGGDEAASSLIALSKVGSYSFLRNYEKFD